MERSHKQRIRAIVVSQPGVMRDALLAVLGSCSSVDIAGHAGGALSALTLVRERQPDLLVIDSNLPAEEASALVQQVKREWPSLRCLALVQRSSKQQLRDSGADAALPRSISCAELESAVLELVGRPSACVGNLL